MMPDDFRRIRELFLEAVRLPTAERAAFLAGRRDDPELRERLESMLRHDDAAEEEEDEDDDPGGSGRALDSSPEVSDDFGPYRILRPLGEGGFCIVYLAEQQQPVRRQVALKLIKPGMETRNVIARFEAERQALALMNHPSIAKVHDFGMTGRGRLFFIMEYVPGEPISTFCDRRGLAIRDRLDLFVRVCEAVQHAHQMAIIHRDIKPSNVLVMELDGKPMPKVIDFGIAKSLDPGKMGGAPLTLEGHFLGTPDYMSPEQADPSARGIDTRTDVYSLGVVLYELLAGVRPFDLGALLAHDLGAVSRLLRENEAPRLLDRLRGLPPDRLEAIAGNRGTDPRRLLRELQGDLEWIALRAIALDREDRYGSAAELAADIERHRRDEAVEATPPTLRYRLKKLWARRKAAIATAAALFTGLVATLVVTLSLYLEAQDALRRSEGLRHTALSATALGADPDAALLLALEGHDLYDGIEARNAVLGALAELVDHKVLTRHRSWVRFFELSPDDSLLATSSTDGDVFLWDARTAEYLRSLGGHGSAARLRFSPDGLRLFTGPDGGALAIWDVRTGRRLLAIEGSPEHAWAGWSPGSERIVTISPDGAARVLEEGVGGEVRRFETGIRGVASAAFSPDGTRLAVGSRGGEVGIWPLLEGDDPTRIQRHSSAVHSLEFTPDGRRVLTADYHKARLWDSATGGRILALEPQPPLLHAATLSPDGRWVATAAGDRRAVVWDAATGKVIRTLSEEPFQLTGAGFSQDGRRLITASTSGTARVWDLETGRCVETLRAHRGKAVRALLSLDGRRAVTTGSQDPSVALWDVERRPVPRLDHDLPVNALSLSIDGARLATCDRSGSAFLWSLDDGRRVATLAGHRGEVLSCHLAGDGRRAVTTSSDRTIRLWDVETGIDIRRYPAPAGSQGAQPSPRGDVLALAARDGTRVLLVLPEDGTVERSLPTGGREIWRVGFSGDGDVVWAATDAGAILWRRATGDLLATLRGHRERIRSVEIRRDGALVATASADGTARIWHLPSAAQRFELVHPAQVFTATFDPSGDRLLTGAADDTGRVWDVRTGRLLHSLAGHKARLNGAIFSPDGSRILTTSFDHTARLWDAATGKEILAFRGHTDRLVSSACFLPDGARVITGSVDGSVRIWPVDPVAVARRHVPRGFFPGEKALQGGAD